MAKWIVKKYSVLLLNKKFNTMIYIYDGRKNYIPNVSHDTSDKNVY